MKRITILTLCSLFIVMVFSSCSKNKIEYESAFQKSYKEWLNFKNTSKNSYEYTVVWSSWTGVSWQTIISVKDGSVIRRSYKMSVPDDWIPRPELEWTEEGNEVGLHDSGAEPITLDEVYYKAEHEWLIKRENTTTYFETKNNGMISTCGFRDNNCADDCFVGITILSIKPF